MEREREYLEEFLETFKNLTVFNQRKILKLVRIMNINHKVAEYLEEKLEYLSFDTDKHDIKIKYLIGDHKIDCRIDEKSITLICKDKEM
ncbi:hypothetical protein [uncultured Phocaeicola sp.]|uniref:hypothetical protein n=1 Tax=uncultured Phocaeicola sp. TaxID=990718 RepID=UPI0032200D95